MPKMISSSPSPIQNPYPLLLSNRSKRPRALPSYMVVLQHSLHLEIRFRAATPSIQQQQQQHQQQQQQQRQKVAIKGIPNVNRVSDINKKDFEANKKARDIYEIAGVLEPREAALLDSTGFLLVHKTFRELCKQYDGRVILISTCGNITPSSLEKNEQLAFYKRGKIIDLCHDPLGWDSDSEDDNRKENEEDDLTIVSKIDLKSIVGAVEHAVKSIQDISSNVDVNVDVEGSPDPHVTDSDTNPSSSLPIPILFDSLQPILLTHGINKTIALLQALRSFHRPPFHPHSPTQTSINMTSTSLPQLTPIVIPVLSNALHPSHHRLLEDASDAVVHLQEGKLNIVKKSHRGTGKITKEHQPFAIAMQDGKETKGIPEIIFTAGSLSNKLEKEITEDEPGKGEDTGADVISDVTFKLGQLTAQEEAMRMATLLPHQKRMQKNKINIQMEEDDVKDKTLHSEKSTFQGPRIYLEDDDPEFDDMDEEDPDDDLDL